MVSSSKKVHRGLVENITRGGEEGNSKDRSGQRTPGEHLRLEGAVSGKAFVARATAQGRVFGKQLVGCQSVYILKVIVTTLAFTQSGGKTLEA